MKILLSVALGGAVGAAARYLVGIQVGTCMGTGYPWVTLAINIVGSFILGSFVALSALVWSPAALYALTSLALVVGALLAGLRLTKWILT